MKHIKEVNIMNKLDYLDKFRIVLYEYEEYDKKVRVWINGNNEITKTTIYDNRSIRNQYLKKTEVIICNVTNLPYLVLS